MMELDKRVMKSIQKTRESDITWIIDVYVLLHKLTNSEVCKGYIILCSTGLLEKLWIIY